MMKRLLFTVVITLAIASYVDAQSRNLTEKETAKNRARPHVEGVAALKRYRGSRECENSDSQTVIAKLKELETSIDAFERFESFEKYAREDRERHSSLAFDFAAEALKRDCLDVAGGVYRRLIVFYTGRGYPIILKRARLGVRGIRSRQASQGATAPFSKTNAKNGGLLVPVTIVNKRFVIAVPTEGFYLDHLWWDSFYDFAQLKKRARAVKGELVFQDLFGEPQFKIKVTITDEIPPGGDHVSKGVGFSWNQFDDSHRWMRTTKVKDMLVVFRVKQVIYADRGRKQYRKGSNARRNILVDPHLDTSTAPGGAIDVPEQARLIEELSGEIKVLGKIYTDALLLRNVIERYEQLRDVKRRLKAAKLRIDDLVDRDVISYRPYRLKFQREVTVPLEEMWTKVFIDKNSVTEEVSLSLLSSTRSFMEDALIDGRLEDAVERFQLIKERLFFQETQVQKIKEAETLKALFRKASTALEFSRLELVVRGRTVVTDGGISTVIINGKTYEEGDALGSELFLQEIGPEWLRFLYKGVEILKKQ